MTFAAVRRHRRFRCATVIVGSGSASAIALMTAGSLLSTASDARTASTPTFSTFERVVEGPATLPIVPSPVIDTSGQFFFGTGDGCIGYYSEQPAQ
jgi:hypothetical protein